MRLRLAAASSRTIAQNSPCSRNFSIGAGRPQRSIPTIVGLRRQHVQTLMGDKSPTAWSSTVTSAARVAT
jgi:hypothetical protein